MSGENQTAVEDLLYKLAKRAGELADKPMNELRAGYPAATGTRAELVRHCKELGLTRGQLVEAILLDEFGGEADGLDWQRG
jgi:hypothetical protein